MDKNRARVKAINKIKSLNYDEYSVTTCRRKRSKDKAETTLVKEIPKTYKVSFNIKVGDKRYKVIWKIETIEADKISDIIKLRCKKEYGNYKSITKIEYEETSKEIVESSTLIEDTSKPKELDKDDFKVKVKTLASIEDIEKAAEETGLNKNVLVGYALYKASGGRSMVEEAENHDNNISTLDAGYDKKGNMIYIRPSGVALLNMNNYSTFNIQIEYLDGTKSNNIEVIAIGPGNAISEFACIISNNHEHNSKSPNYKIKLKYLYENAKCYHIVNKTTGKFASIDAYIINTSWSKYMSYGDFDEIAKRTIID